MSNFTEPIEKLPENNDVRAWLESQMNDKRPTLLAFADDGVIWGRWVNSKLVTALGQPELRGKTLQQAYVFGLADEVRLFRDELGGWQARRVVDTGDVIVESQILWGDQSEGRQGDFLEVSEFRKGIPNQFLPVDGVFGDEECVRLEVHHMVTYNEETGEARIALSRLAGLSIGKKAMEAAK
jgi:CRISPR-associated protein (TIGR03984 family)